MTMSLKQVDMCSWIGINNIVKMTILPQTIYNQLNFYQITSGLFHGIRINFFFFFTFCVQTQRTLNSQSNLKKNGAGEIKLLKFRL